ncbi:MAG: PKD domain-containing protein, partial [Candidatus Peribacteraceae bacterium]|nr:PKD domain-containing protein [Candidatus Peribacteraceae bacterium]
MVSKKSIASVSAVSTIGAIMLVAIMLLPATVYPAIQNQTVPIDVNTMLPFSATYHTEKTVTLSFEEVSEEIILVATFEVEDIPPASSFGDYGTIDDYTTIFVFTISGPKEVIFYTCPDMELTIEKLERGDRIQGYESFTLKGDTHSQLWDGKGALISLPQSPSPLMGTLTSINDKISYHTTTLGEVSRYGQVESNNIEFKIPENSEEIVLRSDIASSFELKVTKFTQYINYMFNTNVIAVAGLDISIDPDDVITFDGSNSIDWRSQITSYAWDLGDGTTSSSPDPTVIHSYPDDGEYPITLFVESAIGYTDIDYMTVYVNNIPPIVDAGDDVVADEDQPIQFTGAAIDTPLDSLDLNFTWYFGDGSMGYEETPSHTYEKSGEYDIILDVTDDNGAIGRDQLTVLIQNVDPVARAGSDYEFIKTSRDIVVYF